ncbi:hypothetical protein ScPMuIL_018136 [Solemya velum]
MGNSNSHIKPISIEQKVDKRVKHQPSFKRKVEPEESCKSVPGLGLISEDKFLVDSSDYGHDDQLQNALEKIAELQKQLDESESQRLDLQSRVEMLEDTTAYLSTESSMLRQKNLVPDTNEASQKYISELETDLETTKQELKDTKARAKKKIKALMRQFGETKQEHSIQLFEFREQINNMKEENTKLKEKQSRPSEEDYEAGFSEPFQKSKNDVILQLSAQISEQAALIEELRQTHSSDHRKENKKNSVTSSVQASGVDRGTRHLPYNESQFDSSAWSYGGKSSSPLNTSSTSPQDDQNPENGQVRMSRDSGLGSAGKHQSHDVASISQVQPFQQSSDSSSEWESDGLKNSNTVKNLRTKKKSSEAAIPNIHRTDSTTSEEELKRLMETQQPVLKKPSLNRNRFELSEPDRFNIPRTTYAFEN